VSAANQYDREGTEFVLKKLTKSSNMERGDREKNNNEYLKVIWFADEKA